MAYNFLGALLRLANGLDKADIDEFARLISSKYSLIDASGAVQEFPDTTAGMVPMAGDRRPKRTLNHMTQAQRADFDARFPDAKRLGRV